MKTLKDSFLQETKFNIDTEKVGKMKLARLALFLNILVLKLSDAQHFGIYNQEIRV
jgi:hypothetical protein